MNAFEQAATRHSALLPPTLAGWVRAHSLEDVWAPALRTTAAWVASSAPSWATEDQRAIACMDLGTCFFALDDSPTDAALRRYDDLERVASGLAPDPSRPLQAAYVDLFARLAATGADISHYLALRRDFARAMRARHSLQTGCRQTSSDAYLALREVTIYFEPWLSTWELLGGFVLSAMQRALVFPVFVAANRWQVLENERASLGRDAASGLPNVISLLACEEEVSISEATSLVVARADMELATSQAATAALRANHAEGPIVRYLDTLADSVAGARRHYERADPARYSSTT